MVEASERQIRDDVIEELVWDDRINAGDIEVEVTGTTVTLRGSVPSSLAHDAAVADAARVPGVLAVHDEVAVAYPTDAMPFDDDLKTRTESTLDWSPDIDSTDIAVSVREGVVRLDGAVDAYWKKRHAEALVAGLRGVVGVENNLVVAPTGEPRDQVIAAEVMSAIRRQKLIDPELIDVTVSNGIVTLTGTVTSLPAYRAAFDKALYTAGVRSVDNRLVVQAPPTPRAQRS